MRPRRRSRRRRDGGRVGRQGEPHLQAPWLRLRARDPSTSTSPSRLTRLVPAGLLITASPPPDVRSPGTSTASSCAGRPTALVLAGRRRDRVDEVARRARTAASRVAAVWGRARPAVWIAPATDADAARLLGRARADDLGGVAAATDGPLTPGERAGADRIVLVPGRLDVAAPRRTRRRHDARADPRHRPRRRRPAACRSGCPRASPSSSRTSPSTCPRRPSSRPALERVRATGLPPSLPADARLRPGHPDAPGGIRPLAAGVRTLADAHGTQAVVRLYRAAAGGLDVPTDPPRRP